MTHNPEADQPSARLRQALAAPDELDCAAAREQIPALVDAERAGQDVDAAPTFAALLRHLDHCASCLALYAELAEDLDALVGEAETLPPIQPSPPSFFTPVRQREGLVLRVLGGQRRRFELILAPPRLAPAIATLSGGQRASLFQDSLVEVAGAPLVAVTLSVGEGTAELLVAIREATAGARWQVRLAVGDDLRSAVADERGIARFGGLPAPLPEITLTFAELPAEA